MTETEHMLGLVRRALDEFEDVALAATARRALRVAELQGDSLMAWWLMMDNQPRVGGSRAVRFETLLDVWPAGSEATFHERHRELLEEWIKERAPARVPDELKQIFGDDKFLIGSVDDLERDEQGLAAQIAQETDHTVRHHIEIQRILKAEVLGRIRSRVLHYLCRCERELTLGVTGQTIFDEYRDRTDRTLATLAPDVVYSGGDPCTPHAGPSST